MRTQVKCAQGRADFIIFMPDTVYVMELKVNDSAKHALEQIIEKGYALPYQTNGRKVVKAGIKFDTSTRTIAEWQID